MGKKLVVGIGNLLLQDEGVGVHVIRALQQEALSPEVELIDGGTAGADLLPLLCGAELIIVVDALLGGGEAGSVYRLTLEQCGYPRGQEQSISLHDLGILEVLRDLELLEGRMPPVVIIGVQPKELDWGMELTPEVRASLPKIIELIRRELRHSGQG